MHYLEHLDQQLFLYLNNLGTPAWDQFWIILTDQIWAIPLYALLTWFMYKKTGFKATAVSLVFIFVMVGFTYGISHLVKETVMRPRPCTMGFDMRYLLSEDCGDYGFFSSHASCAMALILFIGSILKKYYKYVFIPLSIWLALVCYSRIYVGKHYPGDILAGLIAGFICGYIFYRLRKWVAKKYGY